MDYHDDPQILRSLCVKAHKASHKTKLAEVDLDDDVEEVDVEDYLEQDLESEDIYLIENFEHWLTPLFVEGSGQSESEL